MRRVLGEGDVHGEASESIGGLVSALVRPFFDLFHLVHS
jgi:hypothetical protein